MGQVESTEKHPIPDEEFYNSGVTEEEKDDIEKGEKTKDFPPSVSHRRRTVRRSTVYNLHQVK